jgi:hypothetical protein
LCPAISAPAARPGRSDRRRASSKHHRGRLSSIQLRQLAHHRLGHQLTRAWELMRLSQASSLQSAMLFSVAVCRRRCCCCQCRFWSRTKTKSPPREQVAARQTGGEHHDIGSCETVRAADGWARQWRVVSPWRDSNPIRRRRAHLSSVHRGPSGRLLLLLLLSICSRRRIVSFC